MILAVLERASDAGRIASGLLVCWCIWQSLKQGWLS